jgi:ATP-dependent RNA helicase RhlE
MTFLSLGLSQDILEAVNVAGYTMPTEVQQKVIPLILQGRDLIVQAKTGTGKTASFALPMLQLVQSPVKGKRVIQGLVVAPSRELAMQVERAMKAYGRQCVKPLRTMALIGGCNIDVQMRQLQHGVDIAVVTPGRLLDIVRRGAIDLSSLKILVIDEADKMFDLGFAEELTAVLTVLPAQRQNLLFSATMPEKVVALTAVFMQDPVRIVEESAHITSEQVQQRVIAVNRNNRGPLLRHLIQTEQWDQVLIFVARVRDADVLTVKLLKAQISADAFHGGLTQTQRVQVLQDFKAKKFRVMVATDLAARGIDIQHLPYVVNYDLPRSTDDYIHRIGRTARAGAKGVVVSFMGHEDRAHFALIEKKIRNRLPRESIAGYELTGESLPIAKGKLPVKGHRMSKKDKARVLAQQAAPLG